MMWRLIQEFSRALFSVSFEISGIIVLRRPGGIIKAHPLETAGLGGDMNFIKWILNNRYYTRVVGDLVFRNSTELGQITGFGGREVPQAQKFYLGGPNNMKGYQLFLLGPQGISSTGQPQPLGGNVEAFSLFRGGISSLERSWD